MYTIAQMEDAILDALKADEILSDLCRTIDSYNGEALEFAQELDQTVIALPAVLVLYTGSAFSEPANRSFDDEMNFLLLVAASNLAGRKSAARAAYEILEAVKDCLIDVNLDLDIEPLHPVGVDLVAVTKRTAVYGLNLKTSFSMS